MRARPLRHLGLALVLVAASRTAGAQATSADAAADGGGDGRIALVKTLTAERPNDVDHYGASVATDGERLVVGAPLSAATGSRGAVFVYRRDLGGPGAWGLEATIRPPRATVRHFGGAVAVDGDVIAISDQSNLSLEQPGGVFVYTLDPEGVWTPRRALASGQESGRDMFGFSLALAGDTLAVGAYFAGSVFVYRRHEGGTERWGPTRKLEPPKRAPQYPIGDAFGMSVDLRGDLLLVGAPYDPYASSHGGPGAAYLFGRHQGGAEAWGLVARFAPEAPPPFALHAFGYRVAVGATDVIGIWASPEASGSLTRGGIHVFAKSDAGDGGWRLGQILRSERDGELGPAFAMDGARIVARVSPPRPPYQFALALFERTTREPASWRYAETTPTFALPFGAGLALGRDLVAAGARDYEDPGEVSLFQCRPLALPPPPDAAAPDAAADTAPDLPAADAGVDSPSVEDVAVDVAAPPPAEDAASSPSDAAVDTPADGIAAIGVGSGCSCGLGGARPAPASAALALGIMVAALVRRRRYSLTTQTPKGSAGPTKS